MAAELFDPTQSSTYTPDMAFIARLDADPNLFHVAMHLDRPGAKLYVRKFELEHFRPGTKANDALHVLMVGWQQMGWGVLSMPHRYEQQARQVADDVGMRLANGTPTLVTSYGPVTFPIHSRRAWTLENKPASMAYDGPDARDQIAAIEAQKIREVERAYAAWYQRQTQYWFRGARWVRLDHGQQPPASAKHVTMFGATTGTPRWWYTTDTLDPNWRPYPE